MTRINYFIFNTELKLLKFLLVANLCLCNWQKAIVEQRQTCCSLSCNYCVCVNYERDLTWAYGTLCVCMYVSMFVCCSIHAWECDSHVAVAVLNCHQWIISLHLWWCSLIAILSWLFIYDAAVNAFILLADWWIHMCACFIGWHSGNGWRHSEWDGKMPLWPKARQCSCVCR